MNAPASVRMLAGSCVRAGVCTCRSKSATRKECHIVTCGYRCLLNYVRHAKVNRAYPFLLDRNRC